MVTADTDAGFALLSKTYVSPEDSKAKPAPQNASAKGDATIIPGFNKGKTLAHVDVNLFGLEYRWHSNPADDPSVDLP